MIERPALLLLLLGCLFLFGCAGSQRAGGSFRFGWTAPCVVPVEEHSVRKGKETHARFKLDVKDAGEELHVRRVYDEAMLTEGMDMTDPEAQEDLKKARALLAAMPTLVVRKNGEIADVLGLDAMDEGLFAARPDLDNEKVRRAMRSPEVHAMMRTRAASYWDIWVGSWVDFAARPGDPRFGETTDEMFGVQLPMLVKAEHLGPSKEQPELAHVQVVMTMNVDRSAAPFRAILERFAQLAGGAAPPDLVVRKFEKVIILEAFTDPLTLRPARTRKRAQWTVDLGEREVSGSEMFDYRFDWAHAEGCELP